MTIPQQPETPEVPETPDPNAPDYPSIDTPTEIPEPTEPGWRTPGEGEPPMRMPGDNPDVETEI
jgi:hypothetical protein